MDGDMKILLYGVNFYPELTGIGKYTGEMAAWLAKSGHEVHVVTALPYYPEWKIREEFWGNRYTYEVWNDVKIWRAPLWVPGRPSGLKRLVHLASFAISSFPLMMQHLFWRPDVVWVVEPPILCAPTALFLARLTGSRAWLHVQDFEVDAAFALGLLKGGIAQKCVSAVERWLMRRFDKVSTISQSMVTRASAKGVDLDRIAYFPNWIDLAKIVPLTSASSYRAALGISSKTVVALYSGNMGGKQGLEIMGEAARLLTDLPNLLFVFCGNGAGKSELEQLTKGLPNIRFMNLQPIESLNDLLGLADIHLLPQRADAADLVMPSKLTGMLASGRAIVATASPNTELAGVVSGCGLITPPGDAHAFAEAIAILANDASRRKALGTTGRKYAEMKLSIDQILKNFENTLNNRGVNRHFFRKYP